MSVAQEERERMTNMQFTFGLLQRYEIRQVLRMGDVLNMARLLSVYMSWLGIIN